MAELPEAFAAIEAQMERLADRYEAGDIDLARYELERRQLLAHDANGAVWSLGPSGTWYRWTNGTWVAGTPGHSAPPLPALASPPVEDLAPPPPEPHTAPRHGRGAVLVVAGALAAVLAASVAGFFTIRALDDDAAVATSTAPDTSVTYTGGSLVGELPSGLALLDGRVTSGAGYLATTVSNNPGFATQFLAGLEEGALVPTDFDPTSLVFFAVLRAESAPGDSGAVIEDTIARMTDAVEEAGAACEAAEAVSPTIAGIEGAGFVVECATAEGTRFAVEGEAFGTPDHSYITFSVYDSGEASTIATLQTTLRAS